MFEDIATLPHRPKRVRVKRLRIPGTRRRKRTPPVARGTFYDMNGSVETQKVKGATTEAFQAMPGSLYQVAGEQGDDLDNGICQSVRVVDGRMPNLSETRTYNREGAKPQKASPTVGTACSDTTCSASAGREGTIRSVSFITNALADFFLRQITALDISNMYSLVAQYVHAMQVASFTFFQETGNTDTILQSQITELAQTVQQPVAGDAALESFVDLFMQTDVYLRSFINKAIMAATGTTKTSLEATAATLQSSDTTVSGEISTVSSSRAPLTSPRGHLAQLSLVEDVIKLDASDTLDADAAADAKALSAALEKIEAPPLGVPLETVLAIFGALVLFGALVYIHKRQAA